MRFKFCGEADAPDWVLAEINTISKISSVRVKLVIVQILNGIIDGSLDYEKLTKVGSSSSLGSSDVEASIAGLHFILTNAAKNDVDDTTLAKELQQLGMPKEHSDSICRTYAKEKERLQKKLLSSSLKMASDQSPEWAVDYILANQNQESSAVAHVALKTTETGQPITVALTEEKLKLLLHELKTARALMDEV